jgi:hypothetical protein
MGLQKIVKEIFLGLSKKIVRTIKFSAKKMNVFVKK